MIEIILLPYMAVSFFIGWAVFSPFSTLKDLDSMTFDNLQTVDLLAIFIPMSVLLSVAQSAIPRGGSYTLMMVLLAAGMLLFSVVALATGLFLLSKLPQSTPLKRLAINGVILPFGTLLSLAWFVIPIWAGSYSIPYSMPAVLIIIFFAFILRQISYWTCGEVPRVGYQDKAEAG